MPNQEIIIQLIGSHDAFTKFVQTHQDAWDFSPAPERWTFGQHAEHLWLSGLRSASVLKQADAFFAQFGPSGIPHRSYEQLEQLYLSRVAGGVTPPAKQIPPADFSKSPAAFIADWKALQIKTLQRFEANWTEEKLLKRSIPHPALGPVSIKEFLYSISFHIHHHINTLKRDYLKT